VLEKSAEAGFKAISTHSNHAFGKQLLTCNWLTKAYLHVGTGDEMWITYPQN